MVSLVGVVHEFFIKRGDWEGGGDKKKQIDSRGRVIVEGNMKRLLIKTLIQRNYILTRT